MEPLGRLAAGGDEKERKDGVDQARQPAADHPDAEAHRRNEMGAIRLAYFVWMPRERIFCHFEPRSRNFYPFPLRRASPRACAGRRPRP
jgi:hypothetical protein